MKKYLCLIAVAGLTAAGCGDDSGRTSRTRDGGITLPDSGGRDGGGIMLMDSGGMTMRDTGGSTATCTENMPLPQMVPMYPNPAPCAAATGECLMGCMDQACQDACIMADPMAMTCQQCLLFNQINCVNSMGCQSQWAATACCVNTTCPTDMMLGCLSTECADEDMAWTTCANGVVGACGAALGACFMGT